MPFKDYFTLRLSVEHRDHIDKLARELGTSSADVVRTLIDAHIREANALAKTKKGARYIA